LWVLTWFSYWIFLKQQINTVNIAGAAISAGLLLFSYFLPIRKKSSEIPASVEMETSINFLAKIKFPDSEINLKKQIPPKTQTTLMLWPYSNKAEDFQDSFALLEPQEQEPAHTDMRNEPECTVQEPKSTELSQEPQSVEFSQESEFVKLTEKPDSKELAYTPKPAPKKSKKIDSMRKSPSSQTSAKLSTSPSIPIVSMHSICFDKVEELQQSNIPETRGQEEQHEELVQQSEPVKSAEEFGSVELANEPESIESTKHSSSSTLVEEFLQPLSKSNGCPKNLDYYTMKPRPKKTPEECFTCENLIVCVCLTET
jgi:hypothetical protein